LNGGFLINFDSLPFLVNTLVILGSCLLLGVGAYYVVESATHITQRAGISELVIGLTVVAFGTSAPEFAVTINAAIQSHGDISVGNIVGSNIFNLGFILGGCALVRAITTSSILLRRDGTILIASTLLLLSLIISDLSLDRYDGGVLFVLFLIYLVYLFKSRHVLVDIEKDLETLKAIDEGRTSLWYEWGLLIVSLVCIVGGSHLLVVSSTVVAKAFGISEWVIGVTIVAAATSTPEFVVSIMAVLRKRYSIGAGNLVGSCIFNVLGVLGLAGMLRPVDLDPMARVSLTALSGMVFIVLVFIRTGWRVSRLEGIILFAIAAAFWWFDFSMRTP
jgi:cation:H+ antiporter